MLVLQVRCGFDKRMMVVFDVQFKRCPRGCRFLAQILKKGHVKLFHEELGCLESIIISNT